MRKDQMSLGTRSCFICKSSVYSSVFCTWSTNITFTLTIITYKMQFKIRWITRLNQGRYTINLRKLISRGCMWSLFGGPDRKAMMTFTTIYKICRHNSRTFSISQGYQIYYRLQRKPGDIEWDEIGTTVVMRLRLTRNGYLGLLQRRRRSTVYYCGSAVVNCWTEISHKWSPRKYSLL